jgi:DNA-binding transcriptional LysR family regulator
MMTMDHLPVDLLQTFVAVAEAGSFTGAARQLGLRQSTVSQQIRKLEQRTGRRYIDRDTHSLALTPDGEVLLDHARAILDSHTRLHQHLSAAPLRGRLRLGASEDFVFSALPDVLAAFVRRHPDVDLELSAGLSSDVSDEFDAGRLDLIFIKRHGGNPRGRVVWEESLAWATHPEFRVDPKAPLPLLLYPPPSVTRACALETLEKAGRRWRVAFTSASLAGLTAAARAGIGLMPHSARLLPPGLATVAARDGLPALPEIQFEVITAGGSNPAVEALVATILKWAASNGRLGVTQTG